MERRFLKCTLITFTLSYIVVVCRTFAIYIMIHIDSFHIKKWVCKNNFTVNLINCLTYLFIDIIPIATIFYLHFKNFREEEEKEKLREGFESEKDMSVESRDTHMSNTATKYSTSSQLYPTTDQANGDGALEIFDGSGPFASSSAYENQMYFQTQGEDFGGDKNEDGFSTVFLKVAYSEDQGTMDRRETYMSNNAF